MHKLTSGGHRPVDMRFVGHVLRAEVSLCDVLDLVSVMSYLESVYVQALVCVMCGL